MRAKPKNFVPGISVSAPAVYDLVYPITVDGKTVTTITLDEPDVGGIRLLDAATANGSAISLACALLSALSGLPPEAVEKIKLVDFVALQKVAEPFANRLVAMVVEK